MATSQSRTISPTISPSMRDIDEVTASRFTWYAVILTHSTHVLPSHCDVQLPKHPRSNCGADCRYLFATDHGGNDGSSADFSTNASESYGGTDRRRLHSPG